MESRGQQVESNSFRQLADHDAMISSPCPQPALPLMTPEKLNIASTTAPVTTDRLLNSCSPGSPHALYVDLFLSVLFPLRIHIFGRVSDSKQNFISVFCLCSPRRLMPVSLLVC
jgi:hypothetical protein